jgi:hypothetical protein
MKYASEMVSGAMIYMPYFIMIDSDIQMVIWGGYTDTQTAWSSHKPTLGSKFNIKIYRKCLRPDLESAFQN